MRLASYEDFHGEIYTKYWHHEGYAKRARLFVRHPDPILVVGCGFGFLVEELLKIGKDAYGIDAAEYALENRESAIADRVMFGNILEPETLPRKKFGTVITEDVWPYGSDVEVEAAAKNCAALGGIVMHMITEQGEADLNYHPVGYWMALTGQLTTSLEGM